MEGKAVATNAMTPMSRRSREHRHSKNIGAIQESAATQSDIASTSKILKVGIPSSSDAPKHLKDLAGGPSPRRPSRLLLKTNGVHAFQGLETGANGTKVYVQGDSATSPAPNFAKPSATLAGASVALAGQCAGSSVAVPHVVNHNGSSPLPGSDGTPDVAEQTNGRALRARHVTLVKKTTKRSKRFQEVALGEGDGARILGRRIKVFWPLDNKWFYGIVKAYNNGKRLHKIVYDDQDEEWVKLHKEQFKLQVLEGEVFGSQQRVLARQSVEVSGSNLKAASVSGKQFRVSAQEHVHGVVNVANLANGDTAAPQSIRSSCGSPGKICEIPTGQTKTEARNGGEDRQPDPIVRKPGVDVGAVEKSVDICARVSESVDPDDPYSIDSTSISDSLDSFWRSKQSLGELRKESEVKGAVLPAENAIAGAEPFEAASIVKSPGCVKINHEVVTSNLACPPQDANEVRSDLLPSQDCTLEKRGATGRISTQDDKNPIGSKAPGSTDGVILATTPLSSRDILLVTGESSGDGAIGKGESCLGDDVESSTELRHLDMVRQVRGKEKRVRLSSRESVATIISIPSEENQVQFVVKKNSITEASSLLWREDLVGTAVQKGLVLRTLLAYKPPDGRSPFDVRHPQSMWLIRTGRLISQHIATNLVSVTCTIPGQHYPTFSFDSDGVWRCVPYLTLFVSLEFKSDALGDKLRRAFLTCCRKEDEAKCLMLQRSAVLGHAAKAWETSLLCPLPTFATSKLVSHEAQSSLRNGSFTQLVLDEDKSTKVLAQLVLVNPPVEDPAPAEGVVIYNNDMSTLSQPSESKLVEQQVPGSVVPDVQASGSEEENFCQEVEIHSNGPSCICGGEAYPSGSNKGPPCTHCANESAVRIVDTISQAEVPETLTDVRIGSDMDGGKDCPIAVSGCASEAVDTFVFECHQRPEFDDNRRLIRGFGGTLTTTKELQKNCTPSRFLDPLNIKVPSKDEDLDESREPAPVDSLSARGARKSAHALNSSSVEFARSWKSAKRGFLQIAGEELEGNGLGVEGKTPELVCMSLAKRQKVHVESFSSAEPQNGLKENGEKELSHVEFEMNGDKNSKSVDFRDCESSLPRVNVLKLRRCPTNKGLWRVAGNSCLPDRGVRPSGDGGEPLTPSSIADRKRPFSHCLESYQPESPEENGHSVTFVEGSYANGQEMSILQGADELKVKEIWSNCEVSSIQDVTSNTRKRLRNGSTSSVSSDDADAPHSRAEETYPNGAPNDHTYSESLCHGCIANVLVVQNDRGWREAGASIELQSNHGQGWMLIISIRGENLYAYKAEQAMATGSTNRYTHAMVWKGGKGWSLEFDDRKQWQVFKDLHEECFRRNARASSVRHIPIPGVKHIEDFAPRSPGCHFTRPYSRYICGVEDEVEMALANSRVVYDMDSEDEHWLAQVNNERASGRGTRSRPLIAEETLERLMDKLEKDAFIHQQQHKGVELASTDVAAESCNGLASQEVIKVVHSYWLAKRVRKGMPLVRHFQPPPWEQYQKQVQVWEQEIARLQQQSPMASRQQLMQECRKPTLFAFCLRPRGLEARRHKLHKQKTQRRQQTFSGSASRACHLGSIESSLDSPAKRQCCTEPANGVFPGARRPGRPRLTEEAVATDLADSFHAIAGEPTVIGGALRSSEFGSDTLVHSEFAQRRARKSKKIGRKARRLRLLAAAQESRRKRLLLRNSSPAKVYQQPDVAVAAANARMNAEAARARAQALYAVADAAMHKAVTAVIAADALHAAERQQALEEERLAVGGDAAAGAPFGSWRRAVSTAAASVGLGARGGNSRQGLVSDGEDALLPVASWSEELGAGLGTRLLNKEARMEGIGTRSAHGDSPLLTGGLGRTRGESMMAMLTR